MKIHITSGGIFFTHTVVNNVATTTMMTFC